MTGKHSVVSRALRSFPVRVWLHFLDRDGFLLSAGVTYQAMFACFAGIYVAFALAGFWLGGNPDAVQALITIVDNYIPGLIAPHSPLLTPSQVAEIAASSRKVLAVTGIIAVVVGVWTTIGFVTYSRRALCDIFGIAADRRNYLMLKLRDLAAAAGFAVVLFVGFAVTSAGTGALDALFSALGWDRHSGWYRVGVSLASMAISFLLYTVALGSLMRFLTRTVLDWRSIWQGSAIGAAAVTVLQASAGWLLRVAPANPLLATFAVLIGLLLWFRLIGVILLAAASWIAVAAQDARREVIAPSAEQQQLTQRSAALRDVQERLVAAHRAHRTAPWYRARAASRDLEQALDDLERLDPAA